MCAVGKSDACCYSIVRSFQFAEKLGEHEGQENDYPLKSTLVISKLGLNMCHAVKAIEPKKSVS